MVVQLGGGGGGVYAKGVAASSLVAFVISQSGWGLER